MPIKFFVAKGYTSSPPEYKMEKEFSARGVQFYREVMFRDCVNPETGCKLRYDFYIPGSNMLVEFDSVKYHSSDDVKRRDAVKDQYAKSKGIQLIRVSGGGIPLFFKKYFKSKNGSCRAKSTCRNKEKLNHHQLYGKNEPKFIQRTTPIIEQEEVKRIVTTKTQQEIRDRILKHKQWVKEPVPEALPENRKYFPKQKGRKKNKPIKNANKRSI